MKNSPSRGYQGDNLAEITGSGSSFTISTLHTDHLGSTAVISNSSGAMSSLMDCDIAQQYDWGNYQTLNRHFRDHGGDFGFSTSEQYAKGAHEFFDRSFADDGILRKYNPTDGSCRAYDPNNNIFGSYNKDGTTATYYKPDPAAHGQPTNMDYWNSRPSQSF